MKFRRNLALMLICLIIGLMVAWQYKSIYNNQKTTSFDNKRLEDLKDELILETKKIDDLTVRNEELKKENFDYEANSGNASQRAQTLLDELTRVRMLAGLEAVKGKGVIVTIDATDSNFIDDTDILNVLNEMRASDAQAISVNDERIVAMSEVRIAGDQYIMINGKQMLPPFVIKSIGDPETIENSLRIMDGVVQRLESYGLVVKVEKSDDITLPGVRDDGSIIKTNMLSPVN